MAFAASDLLIEIMPAENVPAVVGCTENEPVSCGMTDDPCTACSNCTGCTGCTNCTGCTPCSNCTNCSNCTGCTDCTNCTPCSQCTDCTGNSVVAEVGSGQDDLAELERQMEITLAGGR